MHTDILNKDQKKILPLLSKGLLRRDLYMAGGTALALQTGHRPSIDFDFFAPQIGNPDLLFRSLKSVNLNFRVVSVSFETVYLDIDSVQVILLVMTTRCFKPSYCGLNIIFFSPR